MIIKGNFPNPRRIRYKGWDLHCVHIGSNVVWYRNKESDKHIDDKRYRYAFSGLSESAYTAYECSAYDDYTVIEDYEDYVNEHSSRLLRVRFGNCVDVTKIPDNVDFENKTIILSFASNTNITEIGDWFCQHTKLQGDTVIADGIRKIGTRFLYNATLSGTLTLPSTLETIGDYSFLNITSLTVIVKAVEPPIIGGYQSFGGGVSKIYVPNESVDAYKESESWKRYADKIKPMSEYE